MLTDQDALTGLTNTINIQHFKSVFGYTAAKKLDGQHYWIYKIQVKKNLEVKKIKMYEGE